MKDKQTTKESLFSNSSPPLQKFPGRIIQKEKKKVYNKESKFKGNLYFKLQVIDEENIPKSIFVYPNLVQFRVFNELTNQVHINKWSYFYCEKKGKRLLLRDWKATK